MILGRETHTDVFQMCSMGIYVPFLSEQGALMPFSASRGCQCEISGWRDNLGNALSDKKVYFFAKRMGYRSPTTISRRIRFPYDSPSAHATHCGKIQMARGVRFFVYGRLLSISRP